MNIPSPLPKKQAPAPITSKHHSKPNSQESLVTSPLDPPPDVLAITLTSSAKACYAVCEDGYAYFFSLVEEGSSSSMTDSVSSMRCKLKASVKIAADTSGGGGGGLDEIIGIAACPTSNILASWSENGTVGFWK